MLASSILRRTRQRATVIREGRSEPRHDPHGDIAPDAEAWECKVRKWMSWVAVVGAALFAIAFFAGVAQVSTWGKWDGVAMKHFAAVIGLPSAALAALFIVIVLRTVSGPIELKIPGFEFKGGSGPIVMWMLCFLAIAFAVKLLWPLQYLP